MPALVRRALVALCFALAAAWAWSPLFLHGLRGEELGAAAALRRVEALSDAAQFDPAHARTLAALAGGALARALDGTSASLEVALWRAHHIALLLFAAWLLGRFVRRLGEPWIGAELARAAGWAAAMLFALHPLSVAALASLRAGALLWALVFAFACLWSFLRARQQRDPRALGWAAALATAAGLCHGVALALPLWVAGAEYASSARRRPVASKARAAATAFLGAAACVAIDSAVRAIAADAALLPPELSVAFASLGAPLTTSAVALERLGMLWVAVNAHVAAGTGFVLAGLAALATLHPMLGAARAAPRLWGWILGAVALALFSTEFLAARARVHPLDWSLAETLLPAAAVAASASALAITSRSGASRVALPALVGVLFALVSHLDALAYSRAAGEVAAARAALATIESSPSQVIVVDAPASVLGVRAFDGAPWRCADKDAFVTWLASDASDEARAAGAVWLRPQRSSDGSVRWREAKLRARPPRREGLTWNEPITWLREGRSPALNVDPLRFGALYVALDTPVDRQRPLTMAWRTTAREGQSEHEGRSAGVLVDRGETWEARFDLASDLEWLASDEVRLIWSESGWSRIDTARLGAGLEGPAPGGAMLAGSKFVTGADWSFSGIPPLSPQPVRSIERQWRLVLVHSRLLRSHVLSGELDASGFGLVFHGAQEDAEQLAALGAGELLWRVEELVDGYAVGRMDGVLER